MLSAQNMLAQPLRARYIWQILIKDCFHERIATSDYVTDHKKVWLEADLVSTESFDEIDPLFSELGAHRGIDSLVAPRDAMASRACNQCQPTHECSANTQDMKVHLKSPYRHFRCQ